MMKNFEFYAVSSNNHPLLRSYALRGVVDDRGLYSTGDLLKAQHKVYKDWLDTMRTYLNDFECPFYEWMLRGADTAFVVKEGDLVKYNGQYCVVRRKFDPRWELSWCVVDGVVREVRRPTPLRNVTVEFPDGRTTLISADDGGLVPADIPPEVFALACGRAKDCLMMNRGTE